MHTQMGNENISYNSKNNYRTILKEEKEKVTQHFVTGVAQLVLSVLVLNL